MMDASQILVRNVDKTQLPPLHQKRILAFVNHFLISSCSFLNDFALQCETKFIELERKLQQVEATLIILESKLDPIPSANEEINVKSNEAPVDAGEIKDEPITTEKEDEPDTSELSTSKFCEREEYKKYFKMLKVGVPIEAIKMKMTLEGLNSNILNCPADTTTENKVGS